MPLQSLGSVSPVYGPDAPLRFESRRALVPDRPYSSREEERPRLLPSTARIGRAPFHRARSASKEGTWPLPDPFFSILGGEHKKTLPSKFDEKVWVCRQTQN